MHDIDKQGFGKGRQKEQSNKSRNKLNSILHISRHLVYVAVNRGVIRQSQNCEDVITESSLVL